VKEPILSLLIECLSLVIFVSVLWKSIMITITTAMIISVRIKSPHSLRDLHDEAIALVLISKQKSQDFPWLFLFKYSIFQAAYASVSSSSLAMRSPAGLVSRNSRAEATTLVKYLGSPLTSYLLVFIRPSR